MNRKAYITLALAPLLLAACSSDADEPAPVAPQVPLSFSHSVEPALDSESSRATVIEQDDVESFRVYGALYENRHEFKGYMISGERVIPAKQDNTWVTEKLYYWPDTTKWGMAFFAYSPDIVKGLEIKDIESNPYSPSFIYEPPTDPREQVDLLFATTNPHAPINYGSQLGKPVELQFFHSLMQVYFEIRGNAKRLTSITLKNVFKKGILNLQYSHKWWDPWSIQDNITSYTIEVPVDGILGDDHRLMIIPQKTPYNCSIDITFRDGTTKSIPFGDKFEAGPGGKVYRIILNA